MLINCFCAAGSNPVGAIDDDRPEPPRPLAAGRKPSRYVKRQGSDGSRISSNSGCSSKSNESIAKLAPCKRDSDPKVEAMMMPLPVGPDHRPSKCLRLSYPKIYSDIVCDMKAAKGCRDWRNFAVFYNDDVDMSMTADDAARKRALQYQRNVQQLNSGFDWSPGSSRSGCS